MKQKHSKKTLLTGLTVLALLVVMLGCLVISAGAATTRTAYCQHCKADVTWEPIKYGELKVPNGSTTVHKHYYMTADKVSTSGDDQISTRTGVTLCVDLNGHTWNSHGRAFNLDSTDGVGSTLNIMDSVGIGEVIGLSQSGTNNLAGGVFYAAKNSVLNIYGGTYKLNLGETLRTARGGIVALYTGAKMNLYGGTLVGSTVTDTGGAICIYTSSCELNIYGGRVLSGKATNYGDCITTDNDYTTADPKYRLAGDAEVDEIMFMKNSGKLTVDQTFTGWANVAYRSGNSSGIAAGSVVGTGVAGSLDNGYVMFDVGDGYRLVNDGTNLKLASLSNGEQYRACPVCRDVKQLWIPFDPNTGKTMPAGKHHRYLDKTMTGAEFYPGYNLTAKTQICFDLYGNGYETAGRSLYSNGNTVMNILDTKTGGYIQGSGSNASGGVVYLDHANTVLNLYSGTLKFNKTESSKGPAKGGILCVNKGTFNMYGGTVEGTQMRYSSGISASGNGSGGAIFMWGGTTLNLYGGQVKSGTPAEGKVGPCVYVLNKSATVNLGGNAQVDNIYFDISKIENFSVVGTYTGSATITLPASVALAENTVVGTAVDADLSGGSLRCTNDGGYYIPAENGKLILSRFPNGTVAANGDTAYASVQDAVNAYEGGVIRLYKSVNENITVTKDVTIQLAGYNMSGNITVAEGATLYCMDESTNDFDVSDSAYSKVTGVTGNVSGAKVDGGVSDHDYLAVNEDGAWSFHCVKLEIYAMTLSVDENGQPGLYYKSDFKADAMAAEKIETFGVALSVFAMPDAANLEGENVKYTAHDHFEGGALGNLGNNASSLLKGILKAENTLAVNKRNLNIPVYGRAYAKSADGQILFGTGVCRSLAQQLQGVDAMVETLSENQTAAVVKLYNTFKTVLADAKLPNIGAAVEAEEEGTLKVLVLGNSHGLDATRMLYEVFHTEAPEQKVVIGALYYSGCMVHQHKNFLYNNEAKYEYYKNDGTKADRAWSVKKNATGLEALQDEQWDIILMQQMNYRVGQDSLYESQVWQAVADYLINNQDIRPKLGFHMTWTNPDEDLFANATVSNWQDNHLALYKGEDGKYHQSILYSNIVRCVQKYLIESTEFMGQYYMDGPILASGTAIEYAQVVLSRPESEIYRDYTHLNDYGRLIAAYLWYAQIMGLEEIDEVNIDAIPAVLHHENSKFPAAADNYAITEDMKEDLMKAVNWTLKNPYSLPTEN